MDRTQLVCPSRGAPTGAPVLASHIRMVLSVDLETMCPPIGRVSNGPYPASVPLERIPNWSTSLGIPDSNGAVRGSGDDVLFIGRVSNGLYPVSVPLESITDWSTSLGIPDSNGEVVGS